MCRPPPQQQLYPEQHPPSGRCCVLLAADYAIDWWVMLAAAAVCLFFCGGNRYLFVVLRRRGGRILACVLATRSYICAEGRGYTSGGRAVGRSPLRPPSSGSGTAVSRFLPGRNVWLLDAATYNRTK